MLFTTTWLANIFTHYQGKLEQESPIETVFINSREKVKNALFIPIVGDRFDGHDYVNQAVENGAVAILWDQSKPLPELSDQIAIYFVEDTTKALQQLAHKYRKTINPKVIGITGSNGKTTTKDLVATVVRSTYKTHFTDGNFNNHIGLPLTILSMPNDTEVLVLEMGMSDFGEINLLSQIAQPNYAIITNIGESHIEFLGTRQGIVKAKLEIRNGMSGEGKVIIDGDELDLHHIHNDKNVITCGFQHTNHAMIVKVHISSTTTTFELKDESTFEIPLLGKHHAKNATFAITIGKLLDIEVEKIKESLRNLRVTSMRFEFMTGKNNVTIINDAYNASPTSMIGAIEVIKNLTEYPNKVLVLGDIFELGEHTKKYHQSIGEHISEPISSLFTYGEAAEAIAQAARKRNPDIECRHFTSKESLLLKLASHLNSDTIILFKASRGMQFEQLVKDIKQ